jgi:hypothetical protein
LRSIVVSIESSFAPERHRGVDLAARDGSLHADSELIRADLRGIDVHHIQLRLLIEHEITQEEIAVFVRRLRRHAAPALAARELQFRDAQLAGVFRIQFEI